MYVVFQKESPEKLRLATVRILDRSPLYIALFYIGENIDIGRGFATMHTGLNAGSVFI